jgi:hypothetical protein
MVRSSFASSVYTLTLVMARTGNDVPQKVAARRETRSGEPGAELPAARSLLALTGAFSAALEAHLRQEHTARLLGPIDAIGDGEIKAKVYAVPEYQLGKRPLTSPLKPGDHATLARAQASVQNARSCPGRQEDEDLTS